MHSGKRACHVCWMQDAPTFAACACIQLATPAEPGARGTRRSRLTRCCWSTMLLTARSTAAVLPMPELAATSSITTTWYLAACVIIPSTMPAALNLWVATAFADRAREDHMTYTSRERHGWVLGSCVA